jgi:hypothetical protein
MNKPTIQITDTTNPTQQKFKIYQNQRNPRREKTSNPNKNIKFTVSLWIKKLA